jgi:hypothetical protein
LLKRLLWLVVLVSSAHAARAQDLVPGAYTPAPVGFNVFTATAVFNTGDMSFDPTLPIEDGHSDIGWSSFSFARTLSIGGRYANLGVGVPFVVGTVSGRVSGQFEEASRAGLGDLAARIAVNLYGAPALTPKPFAAYRATTIVGVSLTVIAPTGEYDNARYVNIGTNRWAFKPEVGLSRRRGRWTFEGDFGATFFTDNTDYVNGGTREQSPIGSFQGHLIYTIRPGLWVAGDGNFWNGGRITANGAPNVVDQENSRIGITVAVPVALHQFRISYSVGAYTTIGGDFHSLGVSYSRAWAGRP